MWGIEENGKLWACAFETVPEAMAKLGEYMTEKLSNMSPTAKGYTMEWTFKIVAVSVQRAAKAAT